MKNVYRDSYKPDAFIAKPYTAVELIAHVNKLLGR